MDIKDAHVVIRLLLLGIAAEALVELVKKAAPLQGARQWIIRITPFLRSEEQGHLLECPYCISLWVGVLAGVLYFSISSTLMDLAVGCLIIHRLSNYMHILFSLARDKQLDIRVKRRS